MSLQRSTHEGVAAWSPRVFHPHPIAEFFLATADRPVTVDREPGADAAPRAGLESQAKPNRFVDAHEMLVHDLHESLIRHDDVPPPVKVFLQRPKLDRKSVV